MVLVRSPERAIAQILIVSLFSPALALAVELDVEEIALGLSQPVGLAVRPTEVDLDPVEYYVAEAGKARVIRGSLAQLEDPPVKVAPIVLQDSRPAVGEDSPHSHSSLASCRVHFFNRQTLLLAVGGKTDRTWRQLQVLLAPDSPRYSITPVAELASQLFSDQAGTYTSLASSGDYIFTTLLTETGQGHLLRTLIRSGKPSQLKLLKTSSELPAIIAATLSPKNYLVAAVESSPAAENELELAFIQHTAASRTRPELIMRLPLPLQRVVDLAYNSPPSPAGPQLFALVDAAATGEHSGVYRLDSAIGEAGRPAIAPRLIHSIDRPTSMAFTPDGSLLVASLGEGPNKGIVLRLAGPGLHDSNSK